MSKKLTVPAEGRPPRTNKKRTWTFRRIVVGFLSMLVTALIVSVFVPTTRWAKGVGFVMTGEEADKTARTVIEDAGYGEAFGHALGHGIGLAPHEQPRLGPNSKEPMANGMVFTIEPGIYLSGWGGVRIEDTVVMEAGKIKLISQSKKMGVQRDKQQ